jgi:hypothetical protein
VILIHIRLLSNNACLEDFQFRGSAHVRAAAHIAAVMRCVMRRKDIRQVRVPGNALYHISTRYEQHKDDSANLDKIAKVV